MTMRTSHYKIAYILAEFPKLTETFILREIDKLSQFGFDVQPYSLTPVHRSKICDSMMKKWYCKTFYVPPAYHPECLNAYVSNRHKIRAFHAQLKTAQNGKHSSFRNRCVLEKSVLQAAYLAQQMAPARPEWVHAHFGTKATTVAWVMKTLLGISYSFTPHAFDLYQNSRKDPFIDLKVKQAAFVTCISEYNRQFLSVFSDRSSDAQKWPLIHYGIDAVDLDQKRQRRDICEKPFLLSVGRLVEKKGHQYLIEALNELKKRGKNFTCAIVGEGPLRAFLQDQIIKHALDKHIKLLGNLPHPQVEKLLTVANIFCLPCVIASDGDRDGIPVALIEAMAQGIPVIATQVTGLPELIQDRQNGLLVQERNSQQLAHALIEMMENKCLQECLGQAAKQTVARYFNLDIEVEKLAGHIKRKIQDQEEKTSATGCA